MLNKKQPKLMTKKYFSMLFGGTIAMMVASIMLMADSFIAGAFIGSDAVAGVTLVTPIYSLSVFFGTAISIGVPIVRSKEMGRFNKKGADQAFGLGLVMVIVTGIILVTLTSVFGDMYLRSYTPEKSVLVQARDYLYWMRFTVLILPMQMLLDYAVHGDGDENISAIANVVQGIGNIVLSIILCRTIGIKGIGLASFVFTGVSILILLIHFVKKSNTLRWNLHFSFKMIKKIVSYSIVDASSFLFLALFTSALNAFISFQFGAKYLIIVSAIALCREFQLIFDGIGEAIGPIFGVYVGERNHSALRNAYALANKTAIVEGVIVTIGLVVIAPLAPRFLNVSDPQIGSLIVIAVRLTAIGSTFISLLYLLTSYYLIIKRIALGFVACALRDVVMSIVLAVILGYTYGIYGTFVGLSIAPFIAYISVIAYVRFRYGKEDCPLLLSKVPGNEDAYLFDITVEPQQIIGLQKEVEKLLVSQNVESKTIGKIKLLIEELYMLIREKNNKKQVLSEFTVFIGPEEIKLITLDNGVLFDISENDVKVTSIASYIVATYMDKQIENSYHLTTLSFNRSAFVFKRV